MIERLLYVVVLAWNHKNDTIEALKSIENSNYKNLKIILVDNASTDGTIEAIQLTFPDIEIIASDKNLGVSGGYNLGIQYAQSKNPDYILIANNDIFVDNQMIPELVDALEEDKSAGIAMPKIYHYFGERNRLWCTGAHWRKFPPMVKMSNFNQLDRGEFSTKKYIDYAPSCLLLLRKNMIDQIGVFDTEYFFYFDDWDYSKRARKAGYKILFVPKAKMWHKVSISTQKSKKPSEWWKRMGRSASLYYTNYHSPLEKVIFTIWYIIREIIKGNFFQSFNFLSGVLDFYKMKHKN